MVFSPYHESWRNHPMLNNNFKHMFPGLKPAVAIFATYCAVEFVYDRMFPAKHEHHHAPEPFEGSRYGGAFEPPPPKEDGHH
mmetsp:Transcript_6163/g.10217  ORF Transcript_6163/g.10217 Transcript_6163/m.10217 type:complete len:82 (-) Transcript_6163:314-559(-)